MKSFPIITVIGLLFCISSATAQEGQEDTAIISTVDYKYALGVRGGAVTGFNAKMMIAPQDAIEVIGGSGWKYSGLQLIALYERHAGAFQSHVDGMNWFFGGGLHTGLYDNVSYKNINRDVPSKSGDYLVVGIDGILGIEYFIGEIPFTLGLDIRPTLDIVPKPDFFLAGAISIRYAWGRQ
ncbi:MAG: hypothetical protein WD077_01700 [Bacteroidia bacterium]